MDVKQVMKNLEGKGYQVSFFSTPQEATDYLAAQVQGKTVGFGDSLTLRDMGLQKALAPNNQVWNPMEGVDNDDFLRLAKASLPTQIFFTSVNGMAETGELVNLDGTGNRIAGSLFGHEKVYFVVGTNKIAPTIDLAIERTRKVAAPRNGYRLKRATPCGKTGQCYDCKSPERICNALTIYLHKMDDTQMEVVLIDQEMGL